MMVFPMVNFLSWHRQTGFILKPDVYKNCRHDCGGGWGQMVSMVKQYSLSSNPFEFITDCMISIHSTAWAFVPGSDCVTSFFCAPMPDKKRATYAIVKTSLLCIQWVVQVVSFWQWSDPQTGVLLARCTGFLGQSWRWSVVEAVIIDFDWADRPDHHAVNFLSFGV